MNTWALIPAIVFSPILACLSQTSCIALRGFDDSCFDKAPPPPALVVGEILASKEVRSTEEGKPLSITEASTLLHSLVLHLNGPAQKDMLVMGEPPLTGGDNTWYWVVTAVDKKPAVCWMGGNTVRVLKTRHKEYADMQSDWYSAAGYNIIKLYRYDGRRYRLFHEKTRGLRALMR